MQKEKIKTVSGWISVNKGAPKGTLLKVIRATKKHTVAMSVDVEVVSLPQEILDSLDVLAGVGIHVEKD